MGLFSENVSAVPGIDASAPCYGGAENVLVGSIVVSKFELRNIQWHVFGVDLVESADNSALPAIRRLLSCGVDSADNVFFGRKAWNLAEASPCLCRVITAPPEVGSSVELIGHVWPL
jgi:hypothetical protein